MMTVMMARPLTGHLVSSCRTGPLGAAETLVERIGALLSQCDHYLGKLLDFMDQHGLWDDTMRIVTTDHGFLLGEHGWWGKNRPPFYEELPHIPLFIWDPRCG